MAHVICDISAAMRKSTVALKGQMFNLRKHQQKFCKSTQNKIKKTFTKKTKQNSQNRTCFEGTIM